jgi:hypothetical protein
VRVIISLAVFILTTAAGHVSASGKSQQQVRIEVEVTSEDYCQFSQLEQALTLYVKLRFINSSANELKIQDVTDFGPHRVGKTSTATRKGKYETFIPSGDVVDPQPPKVKLPILLRPGASLEIPSLVTLLVVKRQVAVTPRPSNFPQRLEPGTHYLQVYSGLAVGEDNKPMTWQQIGGWSEPVSFKTNYAEGISLCKSLE